MDASGFQKRIIMRLKSVLLFLICLCGTSAFSQALKSFSEDNVKFPQELQTFLMETDKKETEVFFPEFLLYWNNKAYSGDQKDAIYRTTNTMLKKHMKAFPDFANYVKSLISFAKTKQSDESFDAWQAGLDKLLEKSNRYFNSFINTCNLLFLENTLYSSVSTKWKVTADSYSFGFDSLPKIIFPSADIVCYSKNDSSQVIKTQGVYYTSKSLWRGSGGKITWKNAGLAEDTVWAELKRYNIDMSGSDYVADSVTFYNKTIFEKPLLGRLLNKILANATMEKATYPRFESYNTNVKIKNLDQDVDYEGGFSQRGLNFLGSGTRNKPAVLTFYRSNKPFVQAFSRGFIIRGDRISSENSSIKLMLGNDSITHPGLEIKYLKRKKELGMFRSEQGISKSPFYDSYHQVIMYFDQIKWTVGDTNMQIKMISGASAAKASFESGNYFKPYRFERLQGLEEQNPLGVLRKFSEKIKSRRFFAPEFAAYRHIGESDMKSFLINLSTQGYLAYDLDNDEVILKDKLFFYIESYIGKSDYDVLQFESLIAGRNNASLNLNNFDMKIEGVARVALSDSQNVFIIPHEQQIVLKKNRNFFFGGAVYAGRFEFFGKEFDFDYDAFKINLNNVDSLRLKVPNDSLPANAEGKKPLVMVKSVIEHVTGNLLIDKPDNKSGRIDQPSYPIFNSIKDSYVYYDKRNKQGPVYDRNKFYFHLEPFSVDSLDNFTKAGIAFKGDLISANIFPSFTDTLKLQHDYSLGFIRETPPGGFSAYQGKGTYHNTIYLSNEGLRGSGFLDYIVSTAKSNNFIFFPDSTHGIAYEYEIRKESKDGVAFPSVAGTDVWMRWVPYEDYMDVMMRKIPFDMYDKGSQLAGALRMAPKGLTGHGTVSVAGAELDSKLFTFNQKSFDSDTTAFRLKSDVSGSLAFNSTDVKAHIDMEKREGDFKSNNPDDFVRLPINQYIAYVDRYKWLMDKKEIDLGSETEAPPEGYKYVSIKPGQDSLTFNSPVAKYTLNDNILEAHKVKYILVADATIYPDSGKVVVERDAYMETLHKAKVLANNDTKYHNIYNAEISIAGRKKYSGSGDYDLVNKQKLKQTFHFYEIGVDSSRTYAIGEIKDSMDFSLSPQLAFKGKIELRAPRKNLKYIGYSRMRSKCSALDRRWFKFTSEIDPDSVVIPVNEFLDDAGKPIAVAIGMGEGDGGSSLQAMFLTEKASASRDQFITAGGFLRYDKAKSEFQISSAARLNDPDVPDSYISFNEPKCTWYGEGKINLSNDFGRVNVISRGNITYNYNNNQATMNLLVGLDFYFNDESMKSFSEALENSSTLDPPNTENKSFEKVLVDLIGKEKTTEFLNELSLYGNVKKMPKGLDNQLLLTNVQLTWDAISKSWKSEGKIDVGGVHKTQILKQVNGVVELKKKKSGDVFSIYIEADEFGWYYFSYEDGVMQALSQDASFQDPLNDEKPEKMRLKAEKNLPAYEYMLTTEKKKAEFLRTSGYKIR